MLTTITNRPCQIGGHINARAEKHGDQDVPAVDITLDGIMLTEAELNALLEDPHASSVLFTRKGGKLHEPTFPQLKSFVLKENYENANVTLTVGLSRERIELGGAKLRRITLEPKTGGLTQLSLSVGATASVDQIALLAKFMNHDGNVEITDAAKPEPKPKSKQQEAPLGEPQEVA